MRGVIDAAFYGNSSALMPGSGINNPAGLSPDEVFSNNMIKKYALSQKCAKAYLFLWYFMPSYGKVR